MHTRFTALKQNGPHLSIGTLTGNREDQGSDLRILEENNILLHHTDVMDGKVWPKVTVDSTYVDSIKTSLIKDVHLLIEEPEKHIEDYAQAGADIITVQVEHVADVSKAIATIRSQKNTNADGAPILAGLGIYPTSDFTCVEAYLKDIDVLFVLSVSPTTGSETFFPLVQDRVAKAKSINTNLIVAVDGGIKVNNVGNIAKMRPDTIITGSAIFNGESPTENIKAMHAAMQ